MPFGKEFICVDDVVVALVDVVLSVYVDELGCCSVSVQKFVFVRLFCKPYYDELFAVFA